MEIVEIVEIECWLNYKSYDKLLHFLKRNKQHDNYIHHITNHIVKNGVKENLLNFLNTIDVKLKAKIYEGLLFSKNFSKLPIDYYKLLEQRDYNQCINMIAETANKVCREIYIYCIANYMYFLENKTAEHYYFLWQLQPILNEYEKKILINLMLQSDDTIYNIKLIASLITNCNDKFKQRCINYIHLTRFKRDLNKQELNIFYDNSDALIHFPFKINYACSSYYNFSFCCNCRKSICSQYYFNLFDYGKHEKKCSRLKFLFQRYIYKCQYLSLLTSLLNLDAAWIILNYLI